MDPALTWTMAVALAALFAASAAMKLAAIGQFAAALENYRILPPILLAPAVWLIPALEALAAAGLVIPASRADASVLAAVLLGMFTAAIAINLARGRTGIDCGCFGPALRQELSGWLIARNAMLSACAVVVLIPPSGRQLTWLDAVTIAGGAAALALMYASFNLAIGNAPKLRALRAS